MQHSARSLRRRWLALPLALLLFALGAAPMLSRMTCHESGRSELSVGDLKDCCPGDAEHGDRPEWKAACCDFLKTGPQKADYRSQEPQRDLTLVLAVAGPAIPVYCALEAGAKRASVSRPPPEPLSVRLARHAAFLI